MYERRLTRISLLYRIFAAAEHIDNHLDNTVASTRSPAIRAEKCITNQRFNFEGLLCNCTVFLVLKMRKFRWTQY